MLQASLDFIVIAIPKFCFGYPFIMAWYWMAGGVLFYLCASAGWRPCDKPDAIEQWPPISILVPCYNEGENAEETLTTAHRIDYPDFEIIAINDGCSDDTAEMLDRLAARIPKLRVVHLVTNDGKATALNVGARLAQTRAAGLHRRRRPARSACACAGRPTTSAAPTSACSPAIRASGTARPCSGGCRSASSPRSSASSSARRPPMAGCSPFRA